MIDLTPTTRVDEQAAAPSGAMTAKAMTFASRMLDFLTVMTSPCS
jgi:hypothetical protein